MNKLSLLFRFSLEKYYAWSIPGIICYRLITGLVAIAMVLGVLSPILAVTIASILSSSLSSAASQIAYAGQSYGLKAGLTAGPPLVLPPGAADALKR